MKQVFAFLLLIGLFNFSADAQTCTGAKKASAEKSGCCVAAAKAASLDPTIEKKVCSKSGKVSFVKNTTCATTGKVTAHEVEYCSKSGKFVNVSPSGKAACTKGKKAACSKTTGAKATKVSTAKKKSCSKTCTKGKKAACNKKATKTASAAKVKLVKADIDEN